jgi:serine/threonine protein kinase/TolB-like protein/Flp pilus assembly protein TadD
MTPEDFRRVKEVLQEAFDRDAGERAAFLSVACAGDVDLRRRVEKLLKSDQSMGEFLAHSDIDLAFASELDDVAGSTMAGRHIGPYQIVREIGHGGMGTVYLAERADGQFQRSVAIKLVGRGLGGDAVLRRFRNERQILATLNHSNIAQLLDGGTTEDGLCYLVMEHVEGVPIDTWCDRRKPLLKDRLKLVCTLCAAVQHAHEHQVIHRDLKPSNILVTVDGTPKLLDFGIAKVLNPELSAQSIETTAGWGPMTPEYASPEQVIGKAFSPASDIYSLGIVLYRLLTGRLPYTVQSQDLGHMARAICEEEPLKPSQAAPSGVIAIDLENIVLKALRKEPERRYTSAAEFAEDLELFLQHRPVHAREASLLYRARKFLRRHQAPIIAAASTAVLALALAAGLKVFESARTNWALGLRSIALQPFELWVPKRQPFGANPSLAVVQIENRTLDASFDWLGRAVCDLLATNLSAAKGLQAISDERVRELIGRRLKGLVRLPTGQAREVAREAHADLYLTGALTKGNNRLRLTWRIESTASGRVQFTGSQEADAKAIIGLANEVTARVLARLAPGETGPKSAVLTSNLQALRAYEEGLTERTVFHGPATEKALRRAIDLDPAFVMAYYNLGDWLRFSGNIPEARRIIARAVDQTSHAPAPRHQKLLVQALQLRLDFHLDEAAKVLESAHAEFPSEIEPVFQLAQIRSAEGRFAEAATLFEEVVRMDDHNALAHDQLGYQYAFLGDVPRAIASIDRYAALLPPGDVVPFCSRGDAYLINERYEQAIAQYRAIDYKRTMATAAMFAGDYALSESTLGSTARKQDGWYSSSGDLEAARGKLDRAAFHYEESAERLASSGLLRPWFGLLRVARIYLEQGRPEEVLALGWRHNTPWAAGLRGTAYLLLHQEAWPTRRRNSPCYATQWRRSWATMSRRRRSNSTVCKRRFMRDIMMR